MAWANLPLLHLFLHLDPDGADPLPVRAVDLGLDLVLEGGRGASEAADDDVDAEEVSLAAVNVGIEQSSRSTSTSTSTSTSSSSFLDDVPNKIASNIFWPLRNVSYKDGVIYFHQASEEDKKKMTEEYFGTRGHLPWGDPNKESSIPSRIRNIEFTDTEFDESVCKSVEPKVRSEFGLVPLLCARVRTLTNGGHTSQ